MNYKAIKKRIKRPSQEVGFIKAILYGKSSTGKTTLAATFPKPVILDVREKGTKSVKKVKGLMELKVREWQDLIDVYWYLKKEDHGFETVVIDTAGNAQTMAVEIVMKKHKRKGEVGSWGTMTQQMWGEVASMVKGLLLDYRDLPMNVVFIAHHKIFQQDEDADEDAIRIAPHVGPSLSPSVASVLNAAVDVIGETFIGEEITRLRDKKTGKRKEVRKVDYYLRVGPHSSYITKVRKPKENELPDVIRDPSYNDLIELME